MYHPILFSPRLLQAHFVLKIAKHKVLRFRFANVCQQVVRTAGLQDSNISPNSSFSMVYPPSSTTYNTFTIHQILTPKHNYLHLMSHANPKFESLTDSCTSQSGLPLSERIPAGLTINFLSPLDSSLGSSTAYSVHRGSCLLNKQPITSTHRITQETSLCTTHTKAAASILLTRGTTASTVVSCL